MSEEEKKALDYLKNDVVYWLDKGKDFVVIDIGENEKLHSILNLIDKQQKEIEELKIIKLNFENWKEDYKELLEAAKENDKITVYVDVPPDFQEQFIHKDKIREKIKELEEKSAYWNCDEIEVLRELLEEN